MLYVAVALVVYILTALDLAREAAPQTFREALGGALACTLVAAAWPLALIWRGLLGGAPLNGGWARWNEGAGGDDGAEAMKVRAGVSGGRG